MMSTEQDQKMIRAKLDHDLRSNLNVVLGYSAMLKEEIGTEDVGESVQDLDCITAAGRELLHLNDQVDDLNHLYANEWRSSTDKVAVETLLAETRVILQERYPTHEITLTGAANTEGLDHIAIQKIFNGLVSGLCKYTPKGATIVAEVAAAKDASIDIMCDPGSPHTTDEGRLHAHLERLVAPVLHMSDIKDFEPFYLTTVCRHAGIKIHKVPDRLAFRMELLPACSTAVDNSVILT